jgi:hypothetical protein
LLAAGCTPSLWRVYKFVVDTLRAAVFGQLQLRSLLAVDPRVQRILAEPCRRRKRQSFSALGLS